MLEPALTAGFIAMGMDVTLVGPLPTPAIALLTRSMRADLGVVISASHNPFEDNGIKLFGPDGYKLSDAAEVEIERRMAQPAQLAKPAELGRARRLDDAQGRYIEVVKRTFPKGMRLDGLKVVVDCAHGAAYKVAPVVLWELGADVVQIGVQPDGFNINRGCGAVSPQAMQEAVRETGAHFGIALDGDADRVIAADERGEILDGDQLMALVARSWSEAERLRGGGIVATVMSNLGLERHLEALGIKLIRTPVGDRYVVERMRESGCNVGGEQSGHIILSDYTTTGDGLIAALQALAVIMQSGRPASEAGRPFQPLPQLLKNVRTGSVGAALDAPAVQRAIRDAEARLGPSGRLLIRKSGTEPVIRIMAEGEDATLIGHVVDSIADALGGIAR
jgi:phosphoglucosamine mutase